MWVTLLDCYLAESFRPVVTLSAVTVCQGSSTELAAQDGRSALCLLVLPIFQLVVSRLMLLCALRAHLPCTSQVLAAAVGCRHALGLRLGASLGTASCLMFGLPSCLQPSHCQQTCDDTQAAAVDSMVHAAGAAALSGSPSGATKMDAWDVEDASQIAVQPVLLNKQVRPLACCFYEFCQITTSASGLLSRQLDRAARASFSHELCCVGAACIASCSQCTSSPS